jgi:hypothetical protein
MAIPGYRNTKIILNIDNSILLGYFNAIEYYCLICEYDVFLIFVILRQWITRLLVFADNKKNERRAL